MTDEPISGFKCPNGHNSVVKRRIIEQDIFETKKYEILVCLKCGWKSKDRSKKPKFEFKNEKLV